MAKKTTEQTEVTIDMPVFYGAAIISIAKEKRENVKILKATIIDDLFLEWKLEEELPSHSRKSSTESCTVPIHDHLKFAIQKLHKHLALICDQVKQPKKTEFDEIQFEGFTVSGFEIKGRDENLGVTIKGSRDGKYGTVNLSSPVAKYESSDYPFISELGLDIDSCIEEVEAYLFDGKRAPERQLEMEFPGEEDEGADELAD